MKNSPSRPAGDQQRVRIEDIVDHSRFAGLPAIVCVLTTLVSVFDGFDTQAIAFVAPTLLAEWGTSRSALGVVLASALIGMALGAGVMGPYGDKRGRRPALILTMTLVAIGSLLCAAASTPNELAICRFIMGLGVGGSLPNAMALLVEILPLASRHIATAVTIVGVPIGGALGAGAASSLLSHFGWRSVFVTGAILPALQTLAIYFWMPESPLYLARRPEREGELRRTLGRFRNPAYRPENLLITAEPAFERKNAPLRAVLSADYRSDSLLLWAAFLATMFSTYVYFNWLPIVLTGIGLPIDLALRCSMVFNFGGVIGGLLIAAFMNRLGSRRALLLLILLAVISNSLLAAAPRSFYNTDNFPAILAIMGLAGSAMLSTQTALFLVTAQAYPSSTRSTGVGSALGVGRLGSILSAFGGGIISTGVSLYFGVIAAVLICLGFIVVGIRRHIQPVNTRLASVTQPNADEKADAH